MGIRSALGQQKISPPKTQWCVEPPHSPNARSLARLPRDAMAAPSRTRGRGNTHWQHPGRRVHASVQVEVLCAPEHWHTAPTKAQKHTTLEQPTSGPLPRAHTRSEACDHASAIVHARSAPHRPHLHNIAQHCTMSAQHICRLPHATAHLHDRDALREHGDAARHTRARAAKAPTPHAAARQRRRFATQSTPAAFLAALAPSRKLARVRLMND